MLYLCARFLGLEDESLNLTSIMGGAPLVVGRISDCLALARNT